MKKQSKKQLTHPSRQYEVAVIAVSMLGGVQKSIDTEDAAIRCHELAPELFSWRKYPTQVNLELVRVSLSDAKKAKNGALLSGTGRDGWRLTQKGLSWIADATPQKGSIGKSIRVDASRKNAGSIDTVRRAREVARLEASVAWKSWSKGQPIDSTEAKAVFRIDSYTTARLVEIKLTRMLALFDANSDHGRFLEASARAINSEGKRA